MNALEARIPPPVVALIVALLMWNLSAWWLVVDMPAWRVPVALVLAALGVTLDLCALWVFRRARTTVNPLKPEKVSGFVREGVYRYTRNPMYAGLVLLLCAGAVVLWSPLAWLGPPAFVAYINRFQIAPEERVMRGRFGAEFEAYSQRVRRWI